MTPNDVTALVFALALIALTLLAAKIEEMTR